MVTEADPRLTAGDVFESPGACEAIYQSGADRHLHRAGTRWIERDVLGLHSHAIPGDTKGTHTHASLRGAVQQLRRFQEGIPVQSAVVVLGQVKQVARRG